MPRKSGMKLNKYSLILAVAVAGCSSAGGPSAPSPSTLAQQVEVRRTANGVPHIKAQNLTAAAYAEGYVQSEDYGSRVALSLLRARGGLARWFGKDSINEDFANQAAYRRA